MGFDENLTSHAEEKLRRLDNVMSVDLDPCEVATDNNDVHLEIEVIEHLESATDKILSMFGEYGVKATFFILGVTYESCPSLIREIESKGHEIAFHGFSHRRLDKCDLNVEILKSKLFLDKYVPIGFRAPEALIEKKHIEILEENGFLYDSSIYCPPDVPAYSGRLKEIPISSFRLTAPKRKFGYPRNLIKSISSFEIPWGSGYFLGVLPKTTLSQLISRMNKNKAPAVIFFHPWQIFPYKWKTSLYRAVLFNYYYVDISNKLEYILGKHKFGSFRDIFHFNSNRGE
jgi:peptidoglycan/xylan/chitin deacetylase (PgdA/CDA1 family)